MERSVVMGEMMGEAEVMKEEEEGGEGGGDDGPKY